MKDEDKSKEDLIDELIQLRKQKKKSDKVFEQIAGEAAGNSCVPEINILLVDDNEDFRNLTAKALMKNGFNVIESSEPESAYALYTHGTEPVHLILSDVVLPGESGVELVEKMRSVNPELKAVFMSGYSDEVLAHPDVCKVLDSGEAFLQKPFTIADLIKKINVVMSG